MNGRQVGQKHEWGTFDRRDIVDELKVGENLIEIKVVAPDVPRWGPNADAKSSKAGLAALMKIIQSDGSINEFLQERNGKRRRRMKPQGRLRMLWPTWAINGSAIRDRRRNLPVPSGAVRHFEEGFACPAVRHRSWQLPRISERKPRQQ